MRHIARIVIAATAAALAGCGGTMPGLSPMRSSLTDGRRGTARPSTARAGSGRQHLPALVLISDGAAAAPRDQAAAWAARGYAALARGLPAKGVGNEKGGSAGPDWTDEALASPSPGTNPLYASVAAALTAVSVLAAQPEVDTRRIGLIGSGWGGVVAALAGAVDDRPHALIVARAAGGLNRGPLAEALKKLPAKNRDAWIKDYDPDSYAQA